jgi:hypothetical protein
MRLRQIFLALLAATAIDAHAEAEPPVTPYRPSVSSPALLPAAGQLEFELGGLSARGNGPRRDSLPYTFKLAFNPEWGVLVSGEAQVWAWGDGERLRSGGDTALTVKRAFIVDESSAFGLELSANLPTANHLIGSGHTDWKVNAIYSRDIGDLHMDLNWNETRLGASDPGAGRWQTGLSASFSTPLTEKLAANWELSGTHIAGMTDTAQALLALVYMPNKRIALDIGFTHGLTSSTPRWQLFTGLVIPLARLW